MAAVNRENHEDHPTNFQARNTNSPRIQEYYNTRASEEIQNRVTRKVSQEFSKTESRILGALSRLNKFPQNPQARPHSGTVPEKFQNLSTENQGTNEDGSQHDPHPEVEVSLSNSPQLLGPEETSYKSIE